MLVKEWSQMITYLGSINMWKCKECDSEVGLFDEMGSVYSHDIVLAEVDGEWVEIEHTPKQLELKQRVAEWL